MRQVIFLAMLVTSVLLGGCNQKTAPQMIAEAQGHIEKNELDLAIIVLKNAIAAAPKNSAARLSLGKAYQFKGFYAESEKELRKAMDLGVDNDVIYPLLIKAIYYQDHLDQVVVLAQSFETENKKAQSKVTLYGWIAQIKSGINETSQEAMLDKKRIIEPDLALIKAYEQFLDGKITQAMHIVERLELKEEQLEILLLSGMLQAAQKNYDQSIISFNKAIEMAPNFYIAQYQVIEVMIKNNKLDDAERYVDKLLSLNKQHAYSNLLKSQIAFRRDEYEAAFNAASIAVQNGMDTPFANLIAGISSYELDKLESAYRHLLKISDDLPANHYANRVLAEIKLRLGETENIADLVKNFTGTPEEDSKILAAAAMSMFQQGNVHEAIQFFETSNEKMPNNGLNLMREGLAKISTEDYSGIDILEKAVESDKNMKYAWSLLAQAHMQKNDIEAAFSVAQRWQDVNELEGQVLKAYLLLQIGDTKKARVILEKIMLSTNNHTGAVRFLMLLNAREKKFEKAKPLAEQLLALDNQNFQTYIDLLNISIAQNDVDSVEKWIQNMIDNSDDHEKTIVMKAALSSLYNYQEKYQETIKLLSGIKSLSDERALSILGDTYSYLKDFSAAYQIYNIWLGINPESKSAWLKILTLFDNTRDYTIGLKAVDKALKIFENDFDILAHQALFLIKNNNLEKAQSVVDKIVSSDKENPMLNRLNGELALLNGHINLAFEYSTKYYKKYPNLTSAKLLAEVYAQKEQVVQGGKLMEKEIVNSPSSVIDVHYVAEFYSKHLKYTEAASHYEKLLKIDPELFITVNNYASTLLKLERFEEAYEYANKALKLIPKSPYAMDTAGWALAKQGRVKEALYYLGNAYEVLPTNSEIQLHYAESLIADKQISKARGILKKIKVANAQEEKTLTRLNSSI